MLLPGIDSSRPEGLQSSVPTDSEASSGITNQVHPSHNYTSKLGHGQGQGHDEGQGNLHQIRHHKSHSPLREGTHRAWTDSEDLTWWLNTESEPGGPGGTTGARGEGQPGGWGSPSPAFNPSNTPGNSTFPSISLESKTNQTIQTLLLSSSSESDTSSDWSQQSVISTEGYYSSASHNDSAIYPQHIPSISQYAAASSSQSLPSQAGLAASYLTGAGTGAGAWEGAGSWTGAGAGEHAQHHIPTSSLYNILDVSNSSNSSFVYNISLDGIVNDTVGPPWERPKIEVTTIEIIIAVVLCGFILAIIIGNMFVILSVALFRDMRTLTNGLIVSLASADLLVAIIVLPISLYHEIIGSWTLGPYICDFWITSDVFCCTASILNIVVIAVDRYWLITKNVRYTHNHTFPRQRVVMIMCFVAWVLSGVISSSPLFGWQAGYETRDPYMCIISQDLTYTVFSTFGAFWFPLAIILLVYMKIFKIARKRAKTRARAQAIHPSMNSTVLSEANGKATRYSRPSKSDSNSPQTSPKMLPRRRVSQSHSKRSHRGRIRSSARTLGLIIGGFVFCWLPFFLLATILPFCAACHVPPYVMSIVLWLGYSNSLLNPAIYAIWDKNFRRSFKRLATCSVRWTHIL